MRTHQPIESSKFVQQWAEALGLDPSECRRVVIDAEVDNVVRVYVEKYGTTRLLDVQPPDPSSVHVTVLGVEP